jgi:hypothetical protein
MWGWEQNYMTQNHEMYLVLYILERYALFFMKKLEIPPTSRNVLLLLLLLRYNEGSGSSRQIY